MTARPAPNSLDSHLLRVFCLLISERSVSRVAIRLNQSQPAVSATLRRLRELLGDRILVREKGGMVPTERALQMLPHARAALAAIEKLTGGPDDTLDTRITFRIGSPDYIAPQFMASVVERFRVEAPQASLVIHSLGPDYDFEQALAEGALDIVIGNWPEPPERMHLSTILEDEIVCMVSARHPLARRGMTTEQYLSAIHAVPLPYSISQRGVIDARLAALRVSRETRVTVQSFNLVPYLLVNTDLIFTTSRHFARYYANLLPLTILPSPIDYPPMRFYQLWHDRSHDAPNHRWLRRLILESGRKLL